MNDSIKLENFNDILVTKLKNRCKVLRQKKSFVYASVTYYIAQLSTGKTIIFFKLSHLQHKPFIKNQCNGLHDM